MHRNGCGGRGSPFEFLGKEGLRKSARLGRRPLQKYRNGRDASFTDHDSAEKYTCQYLLWYGTRFERKTVVHSNEVSGMTAGRRSDNCSWFREFQGGGMLSKPLGKLLLAVGGGTLIWLVGLLSVAARESCFRPMGFSQPARGGPCQTYGRQVGAQRSTSS
jgi:hypothetical protein